MQFLIAGHHPPDLCPSANASIRKLASEGGREIPALAERLGVKVNATYVPMTNHMVFVAVEADTIEAVREFTWQGRLSQWNTCEIYAVSTLEEAIERVQELPTVY
jgi:sugar phosphate isomerase/epimerase